VALLTTLWWSPPVTFNYAVLWAMSFVAVHANLARMIIVRATDLLLLGFADHAVVVAA